MKKYFLFFILSFLYKSQYSKTIDNVEIFSLNPQISESYSRISVEKVIRSSQDMALRKDGSSFYKKITNKKTLSKLDNELKKLSICKEDNNINARIVLKINYTDGSSELAVLEDTLSQEIYFNGNYMQRSPSLYKLILKQLPYKYKRHVEIIYSKILCN